MTGSGSRWNADDSVVRGADYDERWRRMAAAGQSIHGEADFICRYEPDSVLDAGCGTGRVAIELGVRGVDVVGVDLDRVMLDEARAKAPDSTWFDGDLLTIDLGRVFDVVALPGNVMIFVAPGTEAAIVANLARHVAPHGVLIAGFQLGRGYTADQYDADVASAGLAFESRYATWQGDSWAVDADYAVSVHRRTAG